MAVSTNINAFEIELGVGYSLIDPWYQSVDIATYPDQADDHVVGKLGISHTFHPTEVVGIKLWLDHYSLLFNKEPRDTNTYDSNAGKNLIGASVVFKLF